MRASVRPCFCLSPIHELCPQPGCWQGSEAPTQAWGSCGVATGDKRAPSSDPHKACPGSLPEPWATYPQLSHAPCTGQHRASRTRTRSNFMAASGGTWHLPEPKPGLVATRAAADVVPAVLPVPTVPLFPGLMSQSRWFRALGAVASWGKGGQHGGFPAGGEAEAGMGHPRQTPAERSACGTRLCRPRGRQQRLAPSTAC